MPLGFGFYMHTRDRRNLETVIPPCFVGESRHQSTLFVGCAWYSGANVELVKSLGADNVIDYTREDFTKNTETHDLIFDAVGATTFDRCKHLLEPQGIFLSCIMGLPDVARSPAPPSSGERKCGVVWQLTTRRMEVLRQIMMATCMHLSREISMATS